MRESNYWLRVLAKAEIVKPERLTDLIEESSELQAILSKSVATAKQRMTGT